MSSCININGLDINYNGDTLTIKGLKSKGSKNNKKPSLYLDKDGIVKGDISGDINVEGNNVQLTIEGNVNGDINAAKLIVKGDVKGDIQSANVFVKGMVKGDIVAANLTRSVL